MAEMRAPGYRPHVEATKTASSEPAPEIVVIDGGPIDGDEQADDDEEDDETDSDSLLLDILHGDFDEDAPPATDAIPADEALRLRQRLRQTGPNQFIFENLTSGRYSARRLLTAFGVNPPEFFGDRPDNGYLRLLGLAVVRDLNTRQKLPDYNTFDDAVNLLQSRRNIVVITGAGISTNLGVPDFRSKDTGFYDQMREKGFSSPEDIFRIDEFRESPQTFYSYSSPTLPEPNKSTPTHAFIKLLDVKDHLLTNYTQNIDNVEGNVGISKSKLIQCHGSWATFTCQKCGYKTDGRKYYSDVKAKRVVTCSECRPPPSRKRKRSSNPTSRSRSRHASSDDDDYGSSTSDFFEPGVMKPDITFFGEKLPDTFFDRFKKHDIDLVDLIVVIGTSMSVSPVSEIPMAVSPDVPQIFISRDRVRHVNFDVTLLGDCDLITEELAKRAGWLLEHPMLKRKEVELSEVDHELAIWNVGVKGEATQEKANENQPQDEESPEPEQV